MTVVKEDELAERKRRLYEQLEAEGLVKIPKTPPKQIPHNPPIQIPSETLSQIIIEKRRWGGKGENENLENVAENVASAFSRRSRRSSR